jgi:hypothetical protein
MSKKLVIPLEQLPPINLITKGYEVRFRLTTEDRNRFSYWSPIFNVDPNFTFLTTGDILIEKHTGYSTIVWSPVLIQKDGNTVGQVGSFDLWVRWGNGSTDGDWQYEKRLDATSENVLKPTSPAGLNTLSVELYYPGRPQLRKATYDVNQSNSAGKVNLTNETITISSINVLKTGYKVLYTSTSAIGGLTSGNEYYVRMTNATTFTLHPTENDALNNTNIINLTSHQNAIGFFTWQDCPVCDFFLYGKYNFSPV